MIFLKAKTYYNEMGYLIIDNVLNAETIDELNCSLGEFEDRKQDEWKKNNFVKKIANNNSINKLLSRLYNDTPLPFQTLNFNYGTTQKEHVDLVHFCPSSDNLKLMCGVWYALEDITDDKGPLIIYPKSHNEEYVLDLTNIGKYNDYENYMKNTASKYQRVNANIKKGSVVIWASNLIHGGHPERKQELTRKSMVTHYFFKSSNYWWTPVLSTPYNICYRNNILDLTYAIQN